VAVETQTSTERGTAAVSVQTTTTAHDIQANQTPADDGAWPSECDPIINMTVASCDDCKTAYSICVAVRHFDTSKSCRY